MGLREVLRVDAALGSSAKGLLLEISSVSAVHLNRLTLGRLRRHLDGQGEKERTAGADFRFHPDVSGVQFDNLLHD